jgi:VanZ family protein
MTRRALAIGLALNVAFVVSVSFAAYAGLLVHPVFGFATRYDYVFHALLIGPLAFFLDGVLSYRSLTRFGWFPPLAPIVVLAIAGVEELLQSLSPRRTTSLHDFVGDTVGVVVCVAVSRWLRARRGHVT